MPHELRSPETTTLDKIVGNTVDGVGLFLFMLMVAMLVLGTILGVAGYFDEDTPPTSAAPVYQYQPMYQPPQPQQLQVQPPQIPYNKWADPEYHQQLREERELQRRLYCLEAEGLAKAGCY